MRDDAPPPSTERWPRHPSTEAILRFFDYEHLATQYLRDVSQPFHAIAHAMAASLDGPELTAGLRKLLEAKDCMVRAALTVRGS